MVRRSFLAIAFFTLAVLATGCGPSWQVVKQANPDPFLGKKKFAVLPVNFTGLRVGEKDEASYLAEKDPESKGKWAGDKEGLNGEFIKGLTEAARESGMEIVPTLDPTGAEFVIKPAVAWLEPGFYAVIQSESSTVRMTVQITTPDGAVLDEIVLEHRTGSTLTTAASGTRLRHDGDGLGHSLGRYLTFRTTGKQ